MIAYSVLERFVCSWVPESELRAALAGWPHSEPPGARYHKTEDDVEPWYTLIQEKESSFRAWLAIAYDEDTDDFMTMKNIIRGNTYGTHVAVMLSVQCVDLRTIPNMSVSNGSSRAGLSVVDAHEFRYWLMQNRPALVQIYDAAHVAIRMEEETLR